jgi:hypothetical protein
MTAAECLATLTYYRTLPQCRRCEYLDWALAQLQQVGDYDLACEACSSRAPADRIEPAPDCRPCPALDAVLAWLQLPALGEPVTA